jgi:hypothetical protein
MPLRRRLTCLVALLAVTCLLAVGCGRSQHPTSTTSTSKPAKPAPATVRVVTFPSIARLTPLVDVEGPEAGAEITLDAARGEREAGQLVAWAAKGSPRVAIEPTTLRGARGAKITAKHVHAYIEQSMVVERGSPAGRSGTYVDPLVPAHGVHPVLGRDQRLLAWIDVDVPLGATPGRYVGEVQLRRSATDEVLASVPVHLRVRRIALPRIPTLASHVGLDQQQLARFEGAKPGTTKLRDITERYATELAHARLSIGDVGALPPGALPGAKALPGDGAYLERVFSRRGVASVRIPFYLDYPFADPIGRDRAAAVRYLRAAARWARAHGWASRAYVFAFDEPDDADAGAVRELHELVHQADPSLRMLVTRESSARAFRGSVDIWGPNISPSRFHPADVERERRAGRATWWYPSITTFAPYPDLFIDERRPAPRALGWLAWRYHVRGILYWTATHWQEVHDPWRDPATYHETDVVGNGDGVLLYPGATVGHRGHPMPSIRLLQMRDGIDDHYLLQLATCAARTRAERARLAARVRIVAPAMDRFNPTGAQVAAMRSFALDLLDAAPGRANCRAT